MLAVRAMFNIDVDGCASPLNALAPKYVTAEDDFLKTLLTGVTVYINPPYSADQYATGCAAINPFVEKLVLGDVRTRGCTGVALLPALTRTCGNMCEAFRSHF